MEPPHLLQMTRLAPEYESQPPNTSLNHSMNSPPKTFRQRKQLFEEAMNVDGKIDSNRIRELAFKGIPDVPGLRSAYWKLLLGYLPYDHNLWNEALSQGRSLYQSWIEDLMVQKEAPSSSEEDPTDNSLVNEDHPLNRSARSQWAMWFKDREMLSEIEKDVRRTFPHLHFFNSGATDVPTKHYEALRRILFMYAKLNPGVGYVQGMNEILGPIYYIFASDPSVEFSEHAEADAFNCFKNLMGEIMNNFCKTLDQSEVGIISWVTHLNVMLKNVDFDLWENLEKKNLNPQFYSFRWLTLLLSQEFELPDVLRLWDSLFSDTKRFEFLIYVCCAMLLCVRDKLLKGDFADNLRLLQNYPPIDIHIILDKAEQLRNENATNQAISDSQQDDNGE